MESNKTVWRSVGFAAVAIIVVICLVRTGWINPFRAARQFPSGNNGSSNADIDYIESHLGQIEKLTVMTQSGGEDALSKEDQEALKSILQTLGPYKTPPPSMEARDSIIVYFSGSSKPAQFWLSGCSEKDQEAIRKVVGTKIGSADGLEDR
ncbi:MAG: hypothetical protein GC165_00245 [Armatimonadetes bacterium]|nr:hypothetical protein [Armatimonadota bacterium]